jgi:predicted outer membrane repeat protein
MRVQFPRLTTRTGLAAVAAVTVAGFGLAPAQAASTVPMLGIPVPCDSGALASAVAGVPSGSTLLLAPGCTYILDEGLPAISKTLTFVGPATLARSDAEETPDFSIMTVVTGGHVLLENVSFLGGFVEEDENDDGGAIYNDNGFVAVNGGVFRYNDASHEGGAIYSEGVLHVTGATFLHNHAGYGGAIYNDGIASITLSHFTDDSVLHYGGAVESDASIHVDLSTFTDDSATYGGGFYVGASTATIENSQFTDNGAEYGGGIYAYYDSNLSNDTFDSNGGKGCYEGGAVFNDDSMTLTGSTLQNNDCAYGAGLYNDDVAVADHDLFQTNSAGTDGGSIYNEDSLTLSASRIHNSDAGDEGGGLAQEDLATITGSQIYQNTAGNTGGGIFNDDSTTLSKSSVYGSGPDGPEPLPCPATRDAVVSIEH